MISCLLHNLQIFNTLLTIFKIFTVHSLWLMPADFWWIITIKISILLNVYHLMAWQNYGECDTSWTYGRQRRGKDYSCHYWPAECMFTAAVDRPRQLHSLLTVPGSSATEAACWSHRQSKLLRWRTVRGSIETNGSAACRERTPLDQRVCVDKCLEDRRTKDSSKRGNLMSASTAARKILP